MKKNNKFERIEFYKSESLKETNCERKEGYSIYHKYKNKIIIGGSCCIHHSKYIEFYDFHKNNWFVHNSLLNYQYNGNNTCLWINEYDSNVIYMSNVRHSCNEYYKQYIEWTDLRENKTKWNILFNNIMYSNLSTNNAFHMMKI